MRQIGDKAWAAWATAHHSIRVPCCVCHGKLRVHVVQGDGALWAINCGACSSGGEPATGYATTNEARAGVEEVELTGIEMLHGKVKYSWSRYDTLGIFDTKEEAQAAADAALPLVTEDREKLNARIQADKWQSASWSLGYHRGLIRDAKRTLDYHTKQIELLKNG